MKKLQRRVQTEIEKLTINQKMHLIFGHCLLDADPFRDGEHRRAVWEAWGVGIIEDYILSYPGRRPLAWWEYEAAEPRRLADGLILREAGPWRQHHGCAICGERTGLPGSGGAERGQYRT